MDVVERHMKREEDLQSIEDSHESFEERYTSPPPPTGPPPKTAMGATPPPPDGPPPVLSDYAPPSAARSALSSAVDNRACRAMAWSPAPGQGRAMAWSPQDGQTIERKKKPQPREKKRKPFESARARPVLSLPSPVLGKGVLPRQSPRQNDEKKELKPSNRPREGLVGRSSKPSIAPEDTITLKGLNERVFS